MKKKSLATFIITLFLFISVAFSAEMVSFPGPEYLADPAERYSIIWQGPSSKDALHRLFLKNLSTGEKRELQSFTHKTDVLWAPDGSAVAITDSNGINATDITVYFPDRPDKTINMQEVLARSFRKLQFVKQNQNVYFEILGWRNQNILRFKVWGQGDNNPAGFVKYFECSMQGKAREVSNHQLK